MHITRRLPPLLLALGLGFLVLGLTVLSLAAQPDPGAAAPTAAAHKLPAGHPGLPVWRGAPAAGLTLTARISTTVRDFFLPGSQPGALADDLLAPASCTFCHDAGYSVATGQAPETETWFAWSGSMMAQSGRDPLFWAALDVANADAAGAGEFCLRCHLPRGWLDGRSAAPDGSAMTAADLEGVQCSVCHRLVDPFYAPENPVRDLTVLAGVTTPVTVTPPLLLPGSATMIVDPLDHRRGPLVITEVIGMDPHATWATLTSPYHREAALCGTCHDISNPVFTWNESAGQYELNPLDQPGDLATAFPVERTYSEWALSAYNTPGGVYAPWLGGNKDYVSTCQDCHMRDVTGVAGFNYNYDPQLRDNMPWHDLTGGNTWVPQIIPLHPVFSSTFSGSPFAELRAQALLSGTQRARAMLQHAATLSATLSGQTLTVTVVNETGHKLPTGYPEGRRMWLQVMGYAEDGRLVYTSGDYDPATAVLTTDADLKLYQVELGVTPELAAALDGIEAGPTFHFALNNTVIADNRIPPRGYSYAAFAAVGAAPVTAGQPDPDRYAAGQHWDETVYALPPEVAYGAVRLLYQTASREYIEFLRDENPYPGRNNGQILYDLWQQTDRSPPEQMAVAGFGALAVYLPAVPSPSQ